MVSGTVVLLFLSLTMNIFVCAYLPFVYYFVEGSVQISCLFLKIRFVLLLKFLLLIHLYFIRKSKHPTSNDRVNKLVALSWSWCQIIQKYQVLLPALCRVFKKYILDTSLSHIFYKYFLLACALHFLIHKYLSEN